MGLFCTRRANPALPRLSCWRERERERDEEEEKERGEGVKEGKLSYILRRRFAAPHADNISRVNAALRSAFQNGELARRRSQAPPRCSTPAEVGAKTDNPPIPSLAPLSLHPRHHRGLQEHPLPFTHDQLRRIAQRTGRQESTPERLPWRTPTSLAPKVRVPLNIVVTLSTFLVQQISVIYQYMFLGYSVS